MPEVKYTTTDVDAMSYATARKVALALGLSASGKSSLIKGKLKRKLSTMGGATVNFTPILTASKPKKLRAEKEVTVSSGKPGSLRSRGGEAIEREVSTSLSLFSVCVSASCAV